MEITKQNTVAEIVAKNMGSDRVFSKYKIDFCCGGGVTMEVACKESGVAFEVLKNEIEKIATKISSEVNPIDLDSNNLTHEVEKVYYNYFNENIQQLLPLAKKVAEVHGNQHKEVIEINTLFKEIAFALTKMIEASKLNLLSLIEKTNKSNNKISSELKKDFSSMIYQNDIAQNLMINSFKEIVKLSSNYMVPESACSSYKLLYQKLHEFEFQLHKYIHFEKNILFPKVLKIIA